MKEILIEFRHLKNEKLFKVKKVEIFKEQNYLYTVVNGIRKNVYIDETTKAYFIKAVSD